MSYFVLCIVLFDGIQCIASFFRAIKDKCVVNVNEPLIVCGAQVK